MFTFTEENCTQTITWTKQLNHSDRQFHLQTSAKATGKQLTDNFHGDNRDDYQNCSELYCVHHYAQWFQQLLKTSQSSFFVGGRSPRTLSSSGTSFTKTNPSFAGKYGVSCTHSTKANHSWLTAPHKNAHNTKHSCFSEFKTSAT